MASTQQTVLSGDSKKLRKKQAKREAKLMLKVDVARQDMHRAEQKMAKAQSNLEALRVQLQDLETQLAQLQEERSGEVAGHVEPGVEEEIVAPGDINDVSVDVSAIPPAEGRVDIELASEPDSGGESVGVRASNEHAWPPPEVREKVIEALEEKAQTGDKEDENGEAGEEDAPARGTKRRGARRRSSQAGS